MMLTKSDIRELSVSRLTYHRMSNLLTEGSRKFANHWEGKSMQHQKSRRQFLTTTGGALLYFTFTSDDSVAQSGQTATPQDPAYRSGRRSLCELAPPTGKPLSARKTDTGIQTNGNNAERLFTYIANAPRLKGGDLAICAEYGRVEIMDSDDEQVRLQIRCSSSGEGAAKALADTDVRAHLTADNGLLRVAVWHATQGFAQQMQPCLVNIRLQVPPSGAYKLDALANHGCVGVHRLTLAGAKLRGLSGVKMRGVKGYLGGHDLDNVILSGDLDVETSAPPGFGDTWIQGTLTAIASCKVIARTNEGNIRLSFPPDPRTGLDVIGRAAKGRVIIGINDAPPPPPTSPPQAELRSRTQGYDAAPVHIEVSASSENSNVTIVR